MLHGPLPRFNATTDPVLCQNSALLKGYYTLDLTKALVYPFAMMRHKAPGKAHREGITVVQLMDMFPDETAARQWFEQMFWNGDRCCGHCGSLSTSEVPNEKPMPYWCGGCRSYFSVRTGTVLERSHVPLRKWVIAIYLELTSLKSVSSMKLHRDIGVRQATAWFMLHRIREAWKVPGGNSFAGPVEVDETFVGGKARNMHAYKRKQVIKGRGSVGKTAVVGAKDRATNRVSAAVVKNVDQPQSSSVRGSVTGPCVLMR